MPNDDAEWRKFTFGRLLLFALTTYQDRVIEIVHAEGFPEVRHVHFNVTRHIDFEAGSRISDLAKRAGVTKGAMGQLVADCERLGFVRRTADPSDARVTIVALSARGHALMDVTRSAGRRVEAAFAAGVGASEFATLRAGLIALRESIAVPQRGQARTPKR